MIRITTQGRYALRAMVDLALHSRDEPVARQDIAERQGISADYVAQLFQYLQDAALVEGVRGPGGGYRLARGADAISAKDIVEAAEGPIALVYCVDPQSDVCCRRADRCVAHGLWKELSATMKEFLDGVTLQDLCDEARERCPSSAPIAGRGEGGKSPSTRQRPRQPPLDAPTDDGCRRPMGLGEIGPQE
jgi:Rrf2 family iron-sulfur cluster assembly transcriptional regulator